MKKLVTLLFILSLALILQAQVTKTIDISTAGTLSTVLTANELNTVTNLTITGTIDARDFKIMRDNMPLLAELDLSDVTIAAYDGTAGPANVKTNMTSVINEPEKPEPDNDPLHSIGMQHIKMQTKTATTTTYPANEIPISAFYKINGKMISLKSIVLPNSISSIGFIAFYNCPSLTSISMPSSVTSIGSYAFAYCTGLTSITIPASVTSIGSAAFYNCSGLTSITIPASVTSIGEQSFYRCGLINVDNANPNYSGMEGVLYNKLKTQIVQFLTSKTGSFSIPSSVTSIGNSAFRSCSGLTSITIPASVTSIGNDAFYSCTGLTSITIPSSLTSIGNSAFSYCIGLKSITIPSSITSIGNSAFYSCAGLTSITIPASVTSIGNYTFDSCTGLTSVTIPASVTSIGSGAFSSCAGLTSITIPASVTSIGTGAFMYCAGLTSITIPASVTSIGSYAFYSCRGLTSIYAYKTTPIILSSSTLVFGSVNKTTCILYVPIGSKAAYQEAYQWEDFTNIAEMTTAVHTADDVKVNLYPNPTAEGFHIDGFEGKASLKLIAVGGKEILTKQITGNETISVSNLPKGVYIVKIVSTGGIVERKLVKK